MTRHESLDVHVELAGATVLAGRAQFHRGRGRLTATTFQYDSAYIAHPQAYAIDPAFPLNTGTQHTSGLPGSFADSAPDRWGRNLIKKRESAVAGELSRRPQTLDEVDYLARVSDVTRQGALRFSAQGTVEFLDPHRTVPKLIRLPELMRAADTAARDKSGHDLEAVKALLEAGTGSLGGARPKAAVLGEDGRQLIAKFPHHEDDWDVMAWEATALDLAAAAGVRVAPHRLHRIDGRHLLLLDRFDRADPADPHGRIGYVSAMTMLEHSDGETADYADIAERLEEVSAHPTDDAQQLYRRVAVSVAVNNTDDHLRNHGFLHGRRGWTLSPAFDINPNPDPDLRQTTIAGATTIEDETTGLIELARFCRLSEAEARSTLAEVADVVSGWPEVADRNGVPRSQQTLFTEAFDAGIRTLRQA